MAHAHKEWSVDERRGSRFQRSAADVDERQPLAPARVTRQQQQREEDLVTQQVGEGDIGYTRGATDEDGDGRVDYEWKTVEDDPNPLRMGSLRNFLCIIVAIFAVASIWLLSTAGSNGGDDESAAVDLLLGHSAQEVLALATES